MTQDNCLWKLGEEYREKCYALALTSCTYKRQSLAQLIMIPSVLIHVAASMHALCSLICSQLVEEHTCTQGMCMKSVTNQTILHTYIHTRAHTYTYIIMYTHTHTHTQDSVILHSYNCHNDYVLAKCAFNSLHKEFYGKQIFDMLDELQAVHEDLVKGFRTCMQKQVQLREEKVCTAKGKFYVEYNISTMKLYMQLLLNSIALNIHCMKYVHGYLPVVSTRERVVVMGSSIYVL